VGFVGGRAVLHHQLGERLATHGKDPETDDRDGDDRRGDDGQRDARGDHVAAR
jgi:hypothetical protein